MIHILSNFDCRKKYTGGGDTRASRHEKRSEDR
jgi:hypothetical protein